VEIYRGNAPVQADRAGIGGAIFFDPERPSNLRPTAGGMLGSFGAKSGSGHVRARVRLANVLDQPRFDLVGFPLPGRAVYAAMEVQW
jgi:hypothetical protein